jgi:hypothetical protein
MNHPWSAFQRERISQRVVDLFRPHPRPSGPIFTKQLLAMAVHSCVPLSTGDRQGLRALSTTNRGGLSPPAHTGTSRRARLCDASPKHPNPQPSARKYITTSKFHAIWQCFSQPVIRQPEASFLAPPCLAQPHQKEAPSARPFIKPKRIGYPACPAPLRTPVDSLQPAACRPPYNRNARSRSCSHLRSVTVTAAQQLACSTPCCCRSETPRGHDKPQPMATLYVPRPSTNRPNINLQPAVLLTTVTRYQGASPLCRA